MSTTTTDVNIKDDDDGKNNTDHDQNGKSKKNGNDDDDDDVQPPPASASPPPALAAVPADVEEKKDYDDSDSNNYPSGRNKDETDEPSILQQQQQEEAEKEHPKQQEADGNNMATPNQEEQPSPSAKPEEEEEEELVPSEEQQQQQEEEEETREIRSHQSEDSIDYASASTDDEDNDVDNSNSNNNNHNHGQIVGCGDGDASEEEEEDVAWRDITKRDRPLSSSQASAVMTEVQKVLINRFENAEPGKNFKDVKLRRFDDRLPRFQKAEINIGRRIASGNFADIFCVNSWGSSTRSNSTSSSNEINESSSASASTSMTSASTTSTTVIKEQNPPKSVAVKLLRSNLLLTPKLFSTAASDLVTEGTLLASLAEHPNIVTILGRSVESVDGFASGRRDSVFLVLERLECDMTVRLREWRERSAYKNNRLIHYGISGRRDNKAALLRERLTRMSELAGAMAYLHRHNVIHRYVMFFFWFGMKINQTGRKGGNN